MPAAVSIVIVNWNTQALLRQCLRSLPWDSPDLTLDVIVVDNGSTDGSPEMVAREFPRVRLVRNDDNLGFVKANNQGLAAATGDFLFMLNSDTEVRAGAIERLVAVAAGDATIGAVGPTTLNSDGTRQGSFGPFPRLISRFVPHVLEARYTRSRLQAAAAAPDGTVAVDWLAGSALLCSRRVLDTVGPLDERFFMWYDDLDWCRRVAAHGLRCVLVTPATIVHHGRQSGQQLEDARLQEQLLTSEYLYLRLHHGRAHMRLAMLLRLLKAALSLALRRSPDANRRKVAFHWRALREP